MTSGVFVGRSDELATLLATVEQGRPAAVVVEGEAGLGKSRLLLELAARAPARVLVGGCVDLQGTALPLLPVAEAVRELLDAEGEDADVARLARLLAAGDGAQTLSQLGLFQLVLEVLGRLGEREPIVVAIEDLHWVDRSTLDLLAYLVRNLRQERLVLIVTYRPDEIDE